MMENQKTPEQVIAEMKAKMDTKYKNEREALAEKKRKERNELRQLERKLKKEEQAKLGKVLYEKFGVTSVVALEDEYEVVKKGATATEETVQASPVPENFVLLEKKKADLINAFYKETGEWCLQKQQAGELKEKSIPDRVANFFRVFLTKE